METLLTHCQFDKGLWTEFDLEQRRQILQLQKTVDRLTAENQSLRDSLSICKQNSDIYGEEIAVSDVAQRQGVGIFAKLRASGKIDKVRVTGTNGQSKDRSPEKVIDGQLDTYFRSGNQANAYLLVEFETPVAVVAYKITSFKAQWPASNPHPKNWQLQGSYDGESWSCLDSREENQDLNGNHKTCRFEISPAPTLRFKYFKIIQTGPNHAGTNALVFAEIELFTTGRTGYRDLFGEDSS